MLDYILFSSQGALYLQSLHTWEGFGATRKVPGDTSQFLAQPLEFNQQFIGGCLGLRNVYRRDLRSCGQTPLDIQQIQQISLPFIAVDDSENPAWYNIRFFMTSLYISIGLSGFFEPSFCLLQLVGKNKICRTLWKAAQGNCASQTWALCSKQQYLHLQND